ncbi:stage III sporulation protein AG [Chengkuizengella axinellae]|uniref:Stage III sporulation protein AG n=1 Tax=Chengkuizengella axinellae TaxID=3064388 RepID=A0ABT9J2F1_9BACL|nr:stage III sporulation protein AG [Chengkuizengella sp. 2205SS18-9]MDP5275668.1 stage III sporulation protein AG [Chengkuizengella sp. 2205SS18-9]
MGKLLGFIEKWVGGGKGGEKRIQTFRWLLIIGLVGVMLMILNSFINVDTIGEDSQSDRASPEITSEPVMGGDKQNSPFAEYEEHYEMELKEILEKIVGVGNVDVMVTIDSTEEMVVVENRRDSQQTTTEKDTNGATRNITDVSRSGEVVLSGNETPIIEKKINPPIRGVLVVAQGAENLTVKEMILDSVRKGLEVPAHRIQVVPRKQN